MKPDRIPTRRKPVRNTLYARLFNKAKPKKQRAAAAASAPDEMDEGGINISRSLTIIFAIHIVAICMIFVHKQYLSGRTDAPQEASSTPVAEPVETRRELPVLSGGDKPYMVRKGDNYAIIAQKHNVDESELRELNRGTDIRAGVVLRIPSGKRIVAEVPPEVAAIRDHAGTDASELGLVEILPPADTQPQLIRPALSQGARDVPGSEPVSAGRTHTVKSGENIWRISNQYKVSQKELMAINKITDPTKLKIGQTLKIP